MQALKPDGSRFRFLIDSKSARSERDAETGLVFSGGRATTDDPGQAQAALDRGWQITDQGPHEVESLKAEVDPIAAVAAEGDEQ